MAVDELAARLGGMDAVGLQVVGDDLVAGLGLKAVGAEGLARTCVTALRERGWEGDEELAAALDARLGTGPIPLLRPLPVDLDELSSALEGDPVYGGGRIDLRTGEVWPETVFDEGIEVDDEDGDEDAEDPERWLWVECEGSRMAYRDMELFTAGVADPVAAERLARALDGPGPFRRFRDQVMRWPDLETEWNAFTRDRCRGRARAWLADAGYTPVLRTADESPSVTI